MVNSANALREAPIATETIPVRLAKTIEVELPVVHLTRDQQFAVVSNGAAKMRESAHPYFVVHVASGLRAPVPHNVGKHTLVTAKKFAGDLETGGFFDARSGRPLATVTMLRDMVAEWRP